MNRKSRFLSALRPRQLQGPKTAGLAKRMHRWPRTAAEVDEIYEGAIDTIRKWIRKKQATFSPGSANHAFCERLLALPSARLFEEVMKDAYPNPKRVGCPPYRILMELGTRRRGIDDPWHEHIAHCYPCHIELRTLFRAYQPPDPS